MRSQNVLKKKARRAWRKLLTVVSEEERLEEMVGPPGAWQVCGDFPKQFLVQHGLQPRHVLLEIGCGVLRGGIPLIRYLSAGAYVGLDIRSEAIDEAYRLLAKHHLSEKNPRLLVSRDFGRRALNDCSFDFALAFQVFYHLEDALLADCLAAVSEQLQEGGLLYANVNVLQHPGSWGKFPLVQRPLEFYDAVSAASGLRMRVLGQLQDFGYPRKLGGHTNHMLQFRKAQTVIH